MIMKGIVLSIFIVMSTLTFSMAQVNKTDVRQSGNNLTLNIDQVGSNQNAKVRQNGKQGIITINQSSDFNDFQYVTVTQRGHANEAFISQIKKTKKKGDSPNQATILQRGYTNIAKIWQNAGNSNEINQHGKFNESYQIIKAGHSNNQYIKQHRCYNFAKQTTQGHNLEGSIDQEGKHNTAYQSQHGNSYNASITQNGEYNEAYQCLRGAGRDQAVMKITQNGNHNWVFQKLTGHISSNTITQNGDYNRISIVKH